MVCADCRFKEGGHSRISDSDLCQCIISTQPNTDLADDSDSYKHEQGQQSFKFSLLHDSNSLSNFSLLHEGMSNSKSEVSIETGTYHQMSNVRAALIPMPECLVIPKHVSNHCLNTNCTQTVMIIFKLGWTHFSKLQTCRASNDILDFQ